MSPSSSGLKWAFPVSAAIHAALLSAIAWWCWTRPALVAVESSPNAASTLVTLLVRPDEPRNIPVAEAPATMHAAIIPITAPDLHSEFTAPHALDQAELRAQRDADVDVRSISGPQAATPSTSPPLQPHSDDLAPADSEPAAFAPSPVAGNKAPLYPDECRRNRQQGTVTLRATVAPDGAVAFLAVERTSGIPLLDQSARQAVMEWRFTPARRGDQAIEADILIPIEFQMRARDAR